MTYRTACYRSRLASDFILLLTLDAVQGLFSNRNSMNCLIEKNTNLWFNELLHIIHYLLYQKRIQSCRKNNSQRTEVYILYVNSFTFKCSGHQNENIIEWKLMTGNLFHSNKNRLVTCDFLSLDSMEWWFTKGDHLPKVHLLLFWLLKCTLLMTSKDTLFFWKKYFIDQIIPIDLEWVYECLTFNRFDHVYDNYSKS